MDNKKILYVGALAIILFVLTFVAGGSLGVFSFLGSTSSEIATNVLLIRILLGTIIVLIGLFYFITRRKH